MTIKEVRVKIRVLQEAQEAARNIYIKAMEDQELFRPAGKELNQDISDLAGDLSDVLESEINRLQELIDNTEVYTA